MDMTDVLKMSMYDTPPTLEQAEARIAMIYARELVPDKNADAQAKVKSAGCYPSNLTDMVFKNIDQFLYCLKHMTSFGNRWEAEAKVILNAGALKKVYAGQAFQGDNRFVFILEEKPHLMRVILARTIQVPEEYAQWFLDLKAILKDGDEL